MNSSQPQRGFQTRCLFDAFLFLSAAIAINLIWFGYNPGFRELTWHPFLALITLIGLFYGLREALAAVILSNLAYACLIARAGLPFSALFAAPDRGHLISFLVAGLFFGEVGELYRRYTLRLGRDLDISREELGRRSTQMLDLEQANLELRESIRFSEAHLFELHRLVPPLLSKDKPQIFESTLELVEKVVGAQASALYLFDSASNTYWRHSARGADGLSPVRVPVDTPPFPELKVKSGVLSVKDLVNTGTPSVIQFMLAAPLKANGSFHGAVFIESIPLSRLTVHTQKNFEYLMEIINTLLESAEAQHHKTGKENGVKPAALAHIIKDQQELSRRLHSKLGVLSFRIENFENISKELSPAIVESLVSRVSRIAEKNKRKFDTLAYQGNGHFTLLMHHPSDINVHPYIDRTLEEIKTVTVPNGNEEPVKISFVDMGEPPADLAGGVKAVRRGRLDIELPAEEKN